MRWYFLSDRQEQIPTTEAQFAGLAAQGVLRPGSMVWHDGMSEWKALGEIKPELFAGDLAGAENRMSKRSAISAPASAPPNGLLAKHGLIAANGILFLLLGLVGILYFATQAWDTFWIWKSKQASLEAGTGSEVPWARVVSLLIFLALTVLVTRMGLMLTQAAASFRASQLSRDLERNEHGIQRIQKFFAELIIFSALGTLTIILSRLEWFNI